MKIKTAHPCLLFEIKYFLRGLNELIVIKGLARGDSVYQLTGTCRGAIHFVHKN